MRFSSSDHKELLPSHCKAVCRRGFFIEIIALQTKRLLAVFIGESALFNFVTVEKGMLDHHNLRLRIFDKARQLVSDRLDDLLVSRVRFVSHAGLFVCFHQEPPKGRWSGVPLRAELHETV